VKSQQNKKTAREHNRTIQQTIFSHVCFIFLKQCLPKAVMDEHFDYEAAGK
jgi:hypothetical protein